MTPRLLPRSTRPLLLALSLGAVALPVAAQQTAPKPATKPAARPAAKPTAAKPTAAKPTAAKPTAAKPTATKPTAAKPTAAKPTAATTAAARPATERPAASQPAPGSSSMDADTRAISNYRLTIGTIRKMAQVQENMYAIAKANPGLKDKYAALEKQQENEPEPKTIDEMVKRFDRVPEMKQAIVKAGLTPREYFLATFAAFQAGMTMAVMEMPGASKTPLPGAVAENIAFLKANKAEFDRMQVRSREIEREMKKLAGEEEEEEETMVEEPDTTSARPSRR